MPAASHASTGCASSICSAGGGAITRTPGRRHFDIFAQYAGLFAFLDEHPELNGSRPLLFERDDQPLPGDAAARRASAARGPGLLLPGDSGVLSALQAGRFHPAARCLPHPVAPAPRQPVPPVPGLRAGRAATEERPSARRASCAGRPRGRSSETIARTQRRRPLDPNLAVYSASWHRGVLGDPAAIHDAARMLAPHIRPGGWCGRTTWSSCREASTTSPRTHRVTTE